jgi:hypothetical protein
MSEVVMKRISLDTILALSCLASVPAAAQSLDAMDTDFAHGRIILTLHTMYGVDGPFVGEANPIRDVVGDELPWTITGFVHGELTSSGRLRILVHGLVFADDPSVPPELVGTNDEAEFRGLVSCLTETEDDAVATQNVTTQGFRASKRGDSYINAHIELPNPCVAPIVMILAGSEDKWFAVTGFEADEDDDNAAQP